MSKTVLLDHDKFTKEMEALNTSQERVAELLGISDRHVRNLKTRDSIISAPLLYRISFIFHKPMEYFLVILEQD